MYSSSQGCHTATGTHMPHGITQCYLPPGRGDIPALEDRTCSSQDMVATDKHTHTQTRTHRQTDRHAHHNTPLACRERNNSRPHFMLCVALRPNSHGQVTADSERRTLKFVDSVTKSCRRYSLSSQQRASTLFAGKTLWYRTVLL